MHHIFAEQSINTAGATHYVDVFDVPDALVQRSAAESCRRRTTTKRPRTDVSSTTTTTTTTPTLLNAADARVLCSVLDFGRDQSIQSPFELLTTEEHTRHIASVLFASSSSPAHGALMQQGDGEVAYRIAIRQALSILCRITAADVEQHFVGTAPATTSNNSDDTNTNHVASSGTMQLYCHLQSLQLELDDVLLAASNAARGSGKGAAMQNTDTHQQQQHNNTILDGIHRRIRHAVDALEMQVIELLLTPKSDGTPRASLSYTGRLVEAIINILREERWPCRVLGSYPNLDGTEHTPNNNTRDVVQPSTSSSCLLQHLRRPTTTTTSLSSSSALADGCRTSCERLDDAITSILLQALLDLRACDTLNLFELSPTTSVSRVAATELNQTCTLMELETCTFIRILAKTWSGRYGACGLRRAMVEMRALFFRLRVEAGAALGRPTSSSSSSSLRMTKQNIDVLEQRWLALLSRHHRHFIEKLVAREVPLQELLLSSTNNSALNDDHNTKNNTFTTCQDKALRVIVRISAVDVSGWYSVPAYDLVNMDFASVRMWVMSESFSTKNNRAAFDALRRTLEGMVDACVAKYGPKHAFSEAITNIRQQLVVAARSEGLL